MADCASWGTSARYIVSRQYTRARRPVRPITRAVPAGVSINSSIFSTLAFSLRKGERKNENTPLDVVGVEAIKVKQ